MEKKERVIIDVYHTEDGYELIKVYTSCKGQYPPRNCDTGYFMYDIDEEYFEDWEVVEDYRC
jgi:hypothetical protein